MISSSINTLIDESTITNGEKTLEAAKALLRIYNVSNNDNKYSELCSNDKNSASSNEKASKHEKYHRAEETRNVNGNNNGNKDNNNVSDFNNGNFNLDVIMTTGMVANIGNETVISMAEKNGYLNESGNGNVGSADWD
ncbi:11015_t:CDS:2 [Ambispora gerdemannii]|uniref:11015_t:CDS:1 n=1 Tax=Ambispora gerdemannii TaxID=144530 RepID=A0A9N9FGW4_9GLOM|nr:11015_t:CDS:2 [Ambispora gerdemannii]